MVTRFGENYWCWSNFGDFVAGTEGLVGALGLNILRAGGNNNDTNTSNGVDPFDDAQIDTFVQYSRSVGAEPLLQVPLLRGFDGITRPGPKDAAAIVAYCKARNYRIQYYEIGNEPDLYADQGAYPSYTVEDYARDFNLFSKAMRSVDPSIRILGPELSWKYYPQTGDNDWLRPFLVLSKGNYDVVSIHRYPFAPQDATIQNALADVQTFRGVVEGVRAEMSEVGLPAGFPLAITEANISYNGDPSVSTQTASPQTFFAGLWVADTLGASLEEGLFSMHYWSLSESWTLSFLDASTRQPKPNYYAFQMVSSHVGTTLISASAPQGFSVYASRNARNDTTILVVINKNATNNSVTFTLTNLPASPPVPTYKFPAYSLTCLEIPDNGASVSVLSYTRDMAANGSPPQQVQ